MQDRAGIYCLINKINGKRYVGSSKHLKERLLKHLSQLESHTHSNKELQEAFDTDGLDMCVVEYIEDAEDREAILDCEQKWINFYNSTNPEYGYNKINSSVLPQFYVPRRKTNNGFRAIRAMDELTRHDVLLRTIWRVIRAFIV